MTSLLVLAPVAAGRGGFQGALPAGPISIEESQGSCGVVAGLRQDRIRVMEREREMYLCKDAQINVYIYVYIYILKTCIRTCTHMQTSYLDVYVCMCMYIQTYMYM